MKSFASLAEFAVQTHVISKNLEDVEQKVIEAAAFYVEDRARSAIGAYDFDWVPLKPGTVSRKSRGDTPLLETGELRSSIQHTIGHHEAWVGSNSDNAVRHELGTSRVPPRPFLSLAAIASEKQIHKFAGQAFRSALAGDHDLSKILHLAKHAFHELKEFGQELVEEPGERRRRR